ncbi:DNA-binding protein [Candidatus Gottesmanbacteria bacterium RIFCSPHIGHO2_02_FULL_39_11]|uniref:DNA-binding protein n=1 Tax=Candidatus Gottesmanbacteria bacterium RIFCSPHIGHO2_02_FULL_39_11 TaxID=1798382 RepID=A0A1F5ZSI4_9BACT|nr:MAG: DNA-binding protein [Candidatus Gottesmanbacteria bacterium RIFCSPHIGHO2_02_FULL_39_11]
MNRLLFKKLSTIRLKEAQILLKKGHYSGAYYISGYVIECALKACIARKTRKGDFPLDRKSLDNIYTHELEKLIKGAGLEIKLNNQIKADKTFDTYWGVAKDWSENARYEQHQRKKAEDMILSITDSRKGVLQWIQKYW